MHLDYFYHSPLHLKYIIQSEKHFSRNHKKDRMLKMELVSNGMSCINNQLIS